MLVLLRTNVTQNWLITSTFSTKFQWKYMSLPSFLQKYHNSYPIYFTLYNGQQDIFGISLHFQYINLPKPIFQNPSWWRHWVTSQVICVKYTFSFNFYSNLAYNDDVTLWRHSTGFENRIFLHFKLYSFQLYMLFHFNLCFFPAFSPPSWPCQRWNSDNPVQNICHTF